MDQISRIDSVLRLVDRELWIVTAEAGGRRGGLLASWVAAASIDRQRPMLLAGIAPNHFTAELVQENRAFAAHLLRPDQVALAWNFANGSGRQRDKFQGLETFHAATASPILADCLAWCDCHVIARYDAGDRLYLWADVVDAGGNGVQTATSEAYQAVQRPLREHAFFAELSPEQRDALIADRHSDVAQQRPLHEAWRRKAKP